MIEDNLKARIAQGIHVAVEPTPERRWFCRVREEARHPEWTRLGRADFATPEEAVADAEAKIDALVAARTAERDAEVLRVLNLSVVHGRLNRIETTDGMGNPAAKWSITYGDGTATPLVDSPREAARLASLGRRAE